MLGPGSLKLRSAAQHFSFMRTVVCIFVRRVVESVVAMQCDARCGKLLPIIAYFCLLAPSHVRGEVRSHRSRHEEHTCDING